MGIFSFSYFASFSLSPGNCGVLFLFLKKNINSLQKNREKTFKLFICSDHSALLFLTAVQFLFVILFIIVVALEEKIYTK